MFEPFVWFFKTNDTKKAFLCIFITCFLVYVLLNGLYFIVPSTIQASSISRNMFLGFAVIILILLLFIFGYFWQITEQIINRDFDIKANSIYNGKIKKVFIIKMPEFRPIKFIWRGFASIVASVLMVLPYLLMTYYALQSGNYNLPMQNGEIYRQVYFISYVVIYVLFLLFLPGALWNYAMRNSIFSCLNIWKSIYLMETYPLKYFVTLLLLICSYFVNSYLVFKLFELIALFNYSVLNILEFIAMSVLLSLAYSYGLFICAYLIGTIAPPEEV